MASLTAVASFEGAWLSRRDLETKVLSTLVRLPPYADLTAIDIEPVASGVAGSWRVERLWSGHVVQLPAGAEWDGWARAAVEALQTCCYLDPRRRNGLR